MTDRREVLAAALDKGASGRFYDAMVYLHCTRQGQPVLKMLGTGNFPSVEEWCKLTVGNHNSGIKPYTTSYDCAIDLLAHGSAEYALAISYPANKICAAAVRGSQL